MRRDSIVESDALFGQSFERRLIDPDLGIHSKSRPFELVGHDEHDVGTAA
jgi:hypothetical protein